MKRKQILQTIWIFILVNMLYADVLSLMDPASPIRSIMQGEPVPAGGLIAGAVLMETAIMMIILSRVLSFKLNRIVTSIVCVINMAAVATGGHGTYYIFFAVVEIIAMLAVLIISWRRLE